MRMENITLKTAEDAPTARNAHFIMPFPKDSDFVDRPGIWQDLMAQYAGFASRIALVGLGGVGYVHSFLGTVGMLTTWKKITNCHPICASPSCRTARQQRFLGSRRHKGGI
jgi:hypothetical protein